MTFISLFRMKETEIVALERSIADQKSKLISLSGFNYPSDNNVTKDILTEESKGMRISASRTDYNTLKGYKQILAGQAKKRSLDEAAEKDIYLLLTKRYYLYCGFVDTINFTMFNVNK